MGMSSDVDLRPDDTEAVDEGSPGPASANPPLSSDDPLDLKGARLRERDDLDVDRSSVTRQALWRVVVPWCALLGALYAVAIWIIYAAM
jgi:hypothetical protein